MLVVWLHLTGQRCRDRHVLRAPGRRSVDVRCIQRRGHEQKARTAFERQHAAPAGFGWSFWR